MPLYDYRCPNCDATFEARHGITEHAPACPNCGTIDVKRIITTTPRIAGGMMTNAGDSRRASKEQLRDKWAEETPKLREQLVSKLGEETVNRMAPSLNTNYDD